MIPGDQGGSANAVTMWTDPRLVREVYVVSKTHLDLGFTDFAHAVKQRYFEVFIPQALRLAHDLRHADSDIRYVWTTGSWLLYHFLEQAAAGPRKQMEEAIASGDIVWHGLPFTTHTELLDEATMRYGLSLSQRLDQRFGKQTVAAKMTDVPGHTRGVVKYLAEAGIRYLHIGVNAFSAVPDVPALFRWCEPSGSSVIVHYDKASYGDVTISPDGCVALALSHTGDNHGPHDREALMARYAQLRRLFPAAVIRATGLNEFAHHLDSIRDNLPTITQEIGDSWIHGVGSAPGKVARMRALMRSMAGQKPDAPADLDGFYDNLLCVAEHTWGMARAKLNDYRAYSPAALAELRKTERCREVEASWDEQDAYITHAVESLSDPALRQAAATALKQLDPDPIAAAGRRTFDADAELNSGTVTVRFDRTTGAISDLLHVPTQRQWCGDGHGMGLLTYEVFSQAQCETFIQEYGRWTARTLVWGPLSFARQDFDPSGAIQHQRWHPQMTDWTLREAGGCLEVIATGRMPEVPVKQFGAPETITFRWSIEQTTGVIHLTLETGKRQANRYPDALWLSFSPHAMNYAGWRLNKLGGALNPIDVVKGGGSQLHAIQDAVTYTEGGSQWVFESLDAPLVAPGKPELYRYGQKGLLMNHGIHFNLWNNKWNTNFPYWSEDSLKFRFGLRLNHNPETRRT